MTDAIDHAAGLSSEDELYRLRRFRPEFVDGAEQCRLSVLTPADDQGLAADLRVALAYRMAALNADQQLMAAWEAQLAALKPSDAIRALANGASDLDPPLAALARHVDLITLTPADARQQHITQLTEAGFSNGQIVALSELIAFVNFQTRVVAGLRLMRSA